METTVRTTSGWRRWRVTAGFVLMGAALTVQTIRHANARHDADRAEAAYWRQAMVPKVGYHLWGRPEFSIGGRNVSLGHLQENGARLYIYTRGSGCSGCRGVTELVASLSEADRKRAVVLDVDSISGRNPWRTLRMDSKYPHFMQWGDQLPAAAVTNDSGVVVGAAQESTRAITQMFRAHGIELGQLASAF
jgi:hypothetical protein